MRRLGFGGSAPRCVVRLLKNRLEIGLYGLLIRVSRVPLILLFLIFHRKIMEGVSQGGIKG